MDKLTLDEAIKHCLEVAEQNEAKAQKIGVQFLGTTKDREATDCRECATDYRQLAEWLADYKELLQQMYDKQVEADRERGEKEMQSKTNNRLVGFTSFKDDTSRLKKFLNHFAPTDFN